jgi:hypothetical protein
MKTHEFNKLLTGDYWYQEEITERMNTYKTGLTQSLIEEIKFWIEDQICFQFQSTSFLATFCGNPSGMMPGPGAFWTVGPVFKKAVEEKNLLLKVVHAMVFEPALWTRQDSVAFDYFKNTLQTYAQLNPICGISKKALEEMQKTLRRGSVHPNWVLKDTFTVLPRSLFSSKLSSYYTMGLVHQGVIPWQVKIMGISSMLEAGAGFDEIRKFIDAVSMTCFITPGEAIALILGFNEEDDLWQCFNPDEDLFRFYHQCNIKLDDTLIWTR